MHLKTKNKSEMKLLLIKSKHCLFLKLYRGLFIQLFCNADG